MKGNLARLGAVVLGLGAAAGPAAAQMLGNPVYFSPKQGTGITIGADYGRGLNTNSGKTNYFGGRAILGLPMVAITAGGGSAKASGATGSVTSFGADVAVTVLKGPAVPVTVSLQGGAAYSSSGGGKTWHAPLGAALAFNVKSPGASVEPWVAPRLDYTRVSFGAVSANQTKLGASGGVNVGLPSGLGFHAALDYVAISGAAPLLAGVGVHYLFTVPGIGTVAPKK